MKEFIFKPKEEQKNYLNYYNPLYKVFSNKIISQLDYDIRKDTNCVKKAIKR